MPLVTLTVRKPKSSAFKSAVLDAVHAALIGAGVPVTDKFQRVIELDAEDFRFDPSYPDLGSPRDRRLRAHRDPLVGRSQRQGQEETARATHEGPRQPRV